MTRKNYREMREGKATEVFIPQYTVNTRDPNYYELLLTAVAFHYRPVFGCVIKTPFGKEAIRPIVTRGQDPTPYTSKMVYRLYGNLGEKSGMYTYKCSGLQYNYITKESHRKTTSTSLQLKFFNGIFLKL